MQHIELLHPINSGRFGTVYKGFDHQVNIFRAIKVLPRKRHDVDMSTYKQLKRNEISNLNRMNGHPHIVQLIDVLHDVDNTYLVEEYCNGENLQELIDAKSMSVPDKRKALVDTLRAIAGCHSNEIIYCDLKPSNIVYSADVNKYKLVDFGSSCDVRNTFQPPSNVTPMYMPPELFAGNTITYSLDIWSVGILAYLLMYNVHPFVKENQQFDPEKLTQQLVFPAGSTSKERYLIENALSLKPSDRPTACELLHYLKDCGC